MSGERLSWLKNQIDLSPDLKYIKVSKNLSGSWTAKLTFIA
jgi:hypothetical protein